jgi:hypothetical protein
MSVKLWYMTLALATGSYSCGSKNQVPVAEDAPPSQVVDAAPLPIPGSCLGGRIVYGVGGQQFRTTLAASASTENLSQGLNALSAGEDKWASSSADGEWLIMETTRFDSECAGWSCLAVVKSDLSTGEAIKINGALIHGEDYAAVASGGERIVYPLKGGPHEKDLYVSNKSGGSWGAPTLLTAASTYPYNLQPSISADGSKVVFDCGSDPYSQPPTSICEVNTDGSGFRVVWTPEQGATGVQGRADVALHHPGYFADGSIVFEADWNGEQVWRLAGSGPPTVIANRYSNDNSPCVTDSGCIVSIWLERPGSSGTHEIKVMDPSGGNFAMVRTDIDVTDLGTSCSK